MKIAVKTAQLKDALTRIKTLTNKKDAMSSYRNVMITTDDGFICLQATDFETRFSGTYDAIIDEPGKVVLNAKRFLECLEQFNSLTISIETSENSTRIFGFSDLTPSTDDVSDSFVTVLKNENPDYFPSELFVKQQNDQSEKLIGQMDIKLLRTILEHSTKKHYSYSYTYGDFFNGVTWMSTDTTEIYEFKIPNGIERPWVIIPKTAIPILSKILKKSKWANFTNSVRLSCSDSLFTIWSGNETINILRLVDSDIPPYEDLFDTDKHMEIQLEKRALLNVLNSIRKFKGVFFYVSKNSLKISTKENEFTHEIPIKNIFYDYGLFLTPSYLIKCLNLIKEESITIFVPTEKTEIVIKSGNLRYTKTVCREG